MANETPPLLGDPEEAARRLGVEPNDPDLLSELQAASERFRNEVRRPIHLIKDDEILLDGGGGRSLRLPSAPVLKASAEIDGRPVKTRLSPRGLLHRADGHC